MKLAMQKVMRIRGYNITTGQLELVLKGLKESTFTNGKESVYVTRDNVKVASFDFGASASISGSSAFIQEDLLSAQLGSDVEVLTNTTLIPIYETLTVDGSNQAVGTKTATGTAGSEVKFAYILDTDGNPDYTDVQEQDALVADGKFTYDSGTNTYTFHTDIVEGTLVEVKIFPQTSTSKRVKSDTTTFTKTLRLEAEIIFKDVCTDQVVYGMIVAEKGKIMGEFEWAMSEGGEPSVHNFTAEFLETCIENKLYDVFIYDKEDMA